MSDKRQLTVSLLLDSTNFNKNIRLINQSLKEAESEFKLLGAGTEDFEKSLEGMRSKARLLSTQLDAQNKIAAQYGERLKKSNKELAEQKKQFDNLSQKYKAAGEALDGYNKEIEETEKALKAAKAAGNDPLKIEGLEKQLAAQKEQAAAAAKEYKKLGGQVTATETAMYKSNAAISNAAVGLNNAQAKVKELTKELQLSENAWYQHGVAMQSWAEKVNTAAASVERVGNSLTRTVTTPIVGLGTAAAKASIDYESAFAGVRKTVNATGEDAEAFFESLSDSVIQMSKELATGANDIADVMAIAGQLGIENDELVAFTDTIVRLGMSTNLAGEEAASAMARFANITGMQQSMFGEMGSTLVHLGNNFATTEAEIMSMATRLAAAGEQVGLSEQQILGFATALSSLGIEAEAGGSAFSKALRQMETAVATSNEQLSDFAEVAGMTEEAFSAMWESDPAGAFQAFIGGLSKLDEEGLSAIATLDDIGISEIRLTDTLLRATNATGLVADALDAANAAWEENNALQKESDTRLQTTASRLTNIKNSVVAVGMEFAEAMAPGLEQLIETAESVVEWFDKLDDATKETIVKWAAAAAAAGPVVSLLGKMGGALGSTIGTLGRFAQAWGKITTTFKATHSVITALSAGLGTGGALMLGLGAAAAAVTGLIALYNKLEESKPDFSMDASEIEKYRIDVETLRTTVNVDAGVEVKGEILDLKEKFQQILNDGVPETKEVREAMQADIDAAVAEAYKVIEESFAAKKEELDTLFASGIIDEETYNSSLSTLEGQAEAMEADLTAKSQAVTSYLTTLCDQNRATTEAEIAQLNALLEALGLTAEEVMKANDAQMQAYEWAYEKTRLGIGDEDDAKMAAEYIELVADQKLQEINAAEKALREVNAQQMEGLDEEGRIQLAEKETEALQKLQEQREAVNREKTDAYVELLPGAAGGTEELGAIIAKIEKYNALVAEYNKNTLGGGDQWYNFLEWNPQRMTDLLGITNYTGDMEGLLEQLEGYFAEGSPLRTYLGTLAAQGIIPDEVLASEETMLNAVIQLAGDAETATAEMTASVAEAAKEVTDQMNTDAGYDWGNSAMVGMKNGIVAGKSQVVQAMRQAARAAVNAAKDELDIHSPSRVMKTEVGAEATRGAALGMIEEAQKQAKLIRNAYRQLTGEAQAGAMAGTDNRRTYNSESSVSVTGNTFIIRDQLDVQSLAIEIASLTRGYQRGRGMKMA